METYDPMTQHVIHFDRIYASPELKVGMDSDIEKISNGRIGAPSTNSSVE